MALKSLRYWSYLATVIVTVCAILVCLGEGYLRSVLPLEYGWLAPLIISVAMVGNQFVENKRVVRAEDLVHEEYKSEALSDDDIQDVLDSDPQLLNDEYEYRDDGA